MSTSIYGDVVPENDQTATRREHLEGIRGLVGNAYPNKFSRSNVAGSTEGEDTITALTEQGALARLVGDEAFAGAWDALARKTDAGGRPAAEDLEPVNAALNPVTVRVAGRLATPPRVMGKAAFVHLSDGRGRLQIYVRKQEAVAISNDSGEPVEEEESGWKLFQLLDHGDFVGVEGFLFVTRTGELSVHVRSIRFLAKALVPMPDKMHGIADPEIRQRQRYADLIASGLKVGAGEGGGELSARDVFERRSKMIREMRRHLDEHGYIEVETPMLSPIASGAAARPFRTHHNALDIDLYLRIAPELYLKRLVVGGFERVYELNRNFRNEGISTRHNPEFTMLEFYCAYMDADGMMDFCEHMLRRTVENVVGDRRIQFVDDELDFGQGFERLTMKQAIVKYWPVSFPAPSAAKFSARWLEDGDRVLFLNHFLGKLAPESLQAVIEATRRRNPLDPLYRQNFVNAFEAAWKFAEESFSSEVNEPSDEAVARGIAHLFETVAEHHLIQPTFITDFPKPISPLSKASPDDPAVAERFELFIAGMECANGFSELNDPAEQLERFEEQARRRERGDEEAMQTDADYVRALAYGMPPAAGIGIGIDRIAMLITGRRSIRDVILFPHMRPRKAKEDEARAGDADAQAGEAAYDPPDNP